MGVFCAIEHLLAENLNYSRETKWFKPIHEIKEKVVNECIECFQYFRPIVPAISPSFLPQQLPVLAHLLTSPRPHC